MNSKKTYRTIKSLIIVFTLIFSGTQNANADETKYLTQGVRDTMSHAERVRLILNEDKFVTRREAENIVARMDAAKKSEIYGVRGSFRANLDTGEKVLLYMKENGQFTPNHIFPIITSSIRTPEAYLSAGFGYRAPYVHGGVRANLSDTDKEALLREERYR